MSWDDKTFLARGHYVRHAYVKKRRGHNLCTRCGVKRRAVPSGWEYLTRSGQWTSSNPPCARKES